MRKATGRGYEEWFALLDAWGATARTHSEIAAWLSSSLDVPMWWRQSITVDYERARGMRRRYQMADGFNVGASRTVAVSAAQALAAFTDTSTLSAWLPGPPMRPRPSRAKLTARFDWSEPASRVLITITPKGSGKITVTATHEQIPDEATAERHKAEWREHLAALKSFLERDVVEQPEG